MSVWTGLALALFASLLSSACGKPAKSPETAPLQGEWRTFEGTGTATGHRQSLQLGPNRRVSIFSLTGSVLIVGEKRLGEGFRSETIGIADSSKGAVGWTVWTDSRGDQVFGELRGGAVGTGRRFTGTCTGGTGRYEGMDGEYEFEWQFVVEGEDGAVQGRMTGLRGRFRRAGPPSAPLPGVPRGDKGSGHEPR